MQVSFSNNYSLRLARQRTDAGDYPRQHLYGADALLRAGFDVDLIDADPAHWSTSFSSRLGWRAGDLHQVGRLLSRGSAAAVDVAAEPYHAAGLAALRGRRWRLQPLVAVFHGPLRNTPVARRVAAGVDVAVCLSSLVRTQLITEFGRRAEETLAAPWGPDLQFRGYQSASEDFVLSAGKTGRDVELLGRALAGAGVPARIYGLSVSDGDVVAVTPDRHHDLGGQGAPQFAFEQVLPDLQRAAVIAIPLHNDGQLTGLTEIADALALGKPIVMTRNRFVDVDIEAIGCGVWIEPGDREAWRATLSALWRDPERRRSMGAAGRAFAEAEWNNELFGQKLIEAVELASTLA